MCFPDTDILKTIHMGNEWVTSEEKMYHPGEVKYMANLKEVGLRL